MPGNRILSAYYSLYLYIYSLLYAGIFYLLPFAEVGVIAKYRIPYPFVYVYVLSDCKEINAVSRACSGMGISTLYTFFIYFKKYFPIYSPCFHSELYYY